MRADTAAPRRLVLVVLFAILAARGLHAQTARVPGQLPPPDPVATVAAMLRSEDPREQAWGAHHAGRDGLRQLAPDLHQLILSRLSDSSPSAMAAVGIALDALIQMKVPAPDLLSAIHERRPVEAIVLASLAVGSEAEGFLLEVMQSGKGEVWFSAANLLLEMRSRALAPAVLDRLRLTLTVYIVDEGGMGTGGALGGSVGCGVLQHTPGLPPLPTYDLATYAASGWTVVATGPVPVYYRRIVVAPGESRGFCDSSIEGPLPDQRMQYLAAAARIRPEDLPLRGYESHSIAMSGAPSVDAEISRIKADVAARYRRLLQMLVSAGALEPAAVQRYEPVVDLTIEDRRRKR